MTTVLFNVALLATVGWGLMILLPGWSVTKRLVEWIAFPVAISLIYVVGVAAVLSETGFGVIADFGSAEGVIELLANPNVALIVWIHMSALDHLVGVGIFRDNLRHNVVPIPIQSLLLVLTLLFGPIGFLTYWIVRVARRRGSELAGVGDPAGDVA